MSTTEPGRAAVRLAARSQLMLGVSHEPNESDMRTEVFAAQDGPARSTATTPWPGPPTRRAGRRPAGASMAVIGRVALAAVLWLIAFLLADLQAPSPRPEREDVAVRATVEAPTPEPVVTRKVAVTNERSRSVVLTVAAATPGDAGPDCPASLVARVAPRAAVEVPPGATVMVAVDVHVDRDAPAACRDAAWPVDLAATAVGPDAAVHAADDDEPGPVPYVIATVAAAAVTAAALLASAAVGRRRSEATHDACPRR